MSRRVRITAIPATKPEVRLYVLALITLARQLQEEEDAAKRGGETRKEVARG
jgi:hypothetical protein